MHLTVHIGAVCPFFVRLKMKHCPYTFYTYSEPKLIKLRKGKKKITSYLAKYPDATRRAETPRGGSPGGLRTIFAGTSLPHGRGSWPQILKWGLICNCSCILKQNLAKENVKHGEKIDGTHYCAVYNIKWLPR